MFVCFGDFEGGAPVSLHARVFVLCSVGPVLLDCWLGLRGSTRFLSEYVVFCGGGDVIWCVFLFCVIGFSCFICSTFSCFAFYGGGVLAFGIVSCLSWFCFCCVWFVLFRWVRLYVLFGLCGLNCL